ncbi:MAG: prepilin-type N-terminal cleavage/methylation domain-containing protein [Candidatus Riflebacteria bacterium]|nr:prepilin-type N-terminal cleavage/methylation domain-containing protein [Candidatus Riflebacteria bacterium]
MAVQRAVWTRFTKPAAGMGKLKVRFLSNYSGFGLIELLIAIVCFTMALIPILNLFSLSIENSKIIHFRSLAYTAAQQLENQGASVPPKDLPEGGYDFSDPTTFKGNNSKFAKDWVLTPLPQGFLRTLTVVQPDPQNPQLKELHISVYNPELPQADIVLKRTLTTCLGGR